MIRVILVDDEEYALEMMEILLERVEDVIVVGKYRSPLKAVEDIGHLDADAVFLDIDMPGMKGNDAARAMRTLKPKLHIVFTTAYSEYALEAFEIKALDYLLKPIKPERLFSSVERIREMTAWKAGDGGGRGMVVTCLGDFDIRIGNSDTGLMAWRTKKEKELCAFLVHHRDQAVDQDVIIETLWPDTEAKKARANLSTCVWQLKKNLQASSLPIVLNKNGKRYSLTLNNVTCDAVMLEELLDGALEQPTQDASWLERVDALYKGEYLGACDFNWAIEKRVQLSSKYVQALWKLYANCRTRRQPATALACMKRIAAMSPESEQAGRELIRLHMEAGNRNEAVKAFRQLKDEVQERLGLELEQETLDLYERLVNAGSRSEL